MYHIIADLHTHTIASTHAYSTISEMVTAAKEKGLYAIGITDHGHRMPGAPGEWYFENLCQLPLFLNGVKTVMGMETNVLDFAGTIDYAPRDNVDFLIASVHDIPGISLSEPTVENCTQMYLQLAKNPKINAIGHSGSPKYKYDYEQVIPEFGRNHKLVEINAHTFEVRPGSVENCRAIALCCKKHGVPILVSSDAHFQTEVGCFQKALKLLEEIAFPEELIVNASVDRLNEYLERFTDSSSNRLN
ncbi:MAG: phosphatase [Oscillospiraceae bacterium]